MANAAEPFFNHLRAATLGLAEAREVVGSLEADAEARRYASDSAVTALEQVGLCMRRYSVTAEARADASGALQYPTPIVGDAQLRAAVESLIVEIELDRTLLGFSGERIVTALKQWVGEKKPSTAQLLNSQIATAIRGLKKKRAR